MSVVTKEKLELGAQLAIAVAVLVVAGVFVKRNLFPAAEVPRGLPPTIQVGEKLNAWQQSDKALVFFLQIGCVHCADAAPFYKQVVEEASRSGVSSTAVLPSSAEDSIKYLKDHDLPIATVLSANPAIYKINATPTVLLVDKAGIVRGRWDGYASGKQKEMQAELTQFLAQ